MSQAAAKGLIRVLKHSNISCAQMEPRFVAQGWTIVRRYEGHRYILQVPEGTEDACVEQAKRIRGIRAADRNIPL